MPQRNFIKQPKSYPISWSRIQLQRLSFRYQIILFFISLNVFAQNPHGAISIECTKCHTTTSWKELISPLNFNHQETQFALFGKHQTISCKQCHTANKFVGTPKNCINCHKNDFTNAQVPNHQKANFSFDCLNCHSNNSWTPSIFDHSKTNFPLNGVHKSADCKSCHVNDNFSNLKQDCYSCHNNDYRKVANPNHQLAQFSHNCLECHTEMVWKPTTFDHSKTNFKLLGAHQPVECSSCHKNGQFKGIAQECFACHNDDYQKVKNPNHQLAQFSHNCLECHTEMVWKPATFDHSKTNFKLLGAHQTVECLFCHKNGQFTGTPKECFPCHQTQFQQTTNPNHVTGNFSQQCETCHNQNRWKPAIFDHSKTNFQLTGAHILVDCAKCHKNGQYTGLSSDCVSCHLTNYNNSNNPNHAIPKFPVQCQICHTTSRWVPSTFDHTPYFPINAGSKHRPGRWNYCSDCHINLTSMKIFSCINCHEHNKSKMDSEHDEVPGYVYESTKCYQCHPKGSD